MGRTTQISKTTPCTVADALSALEFSIFKKFACSVGQNRGMMASWQWCSQQPTMSHQTIPITFALIARIPAEGVADFRAYEDAVLPLLPEFGGRLERRLRNADGTIEMHIVSFASEVDFQNYRNDPRRAAQTALLERSSARLELLPMTDA